MENIQKQLSHISPGIDRINIAVPQHSADNFLNILKRSYEPIGGEGVSAKYWNTYFLINGGNVTVTSPRYGITKKHGYERTYITMLDPSQSVQQVVVDACRLAAPGRFTGATAPIIKAIEVSFDFFTNATDNLIKIKRYVEHHFVMKFLRYGASSTYLGRDENEKVIFDPEESTLYVGKNGDIRKPPKGSRGYIKTENGQTFYRWEVQLNRTFIKNNGITCNDLPLSPLQFRVFDYVDILDDFTDAGLKNVARTILRKQGITEKSTPEFNSLYRILMEELRAEILGGSRGRTPRVTNQIDRAKDVKEDYGITFNHRRYFPELDADKRLITCHADIGYPEENCTKRIILCQGNDPDR